MKKVVIMSDNHGFQDSIRQVYELEKDGDYFVHLGDSEATRKEDLSGWICVAGNNDWGLNLTQSGILEVEDRRILMEHGQYFGYFDREEKMIRRLKETDCTILLSGHTHIPMLYQEDQFILVNPGSTNLPRGGSGPSYAVMYIDGDKVDVEFKDFKMK